MFGWHVLVYSAGQHGFLGSFLCFDALRKTIINLHLLGSVHTLTFDLKVQTHDMLMLQTATIESIYK